MIEEVWSGDVFSVDRDLSRVAREAFDGILLREGFDPTEAIPLRGVPLEPDGEGVQRRADDRPGRGPGERCGTLVGIVRVPIDCQVGRLEDEVRSKARAHAELLAAHLREVGAVNFAEMTPLTVLPLARLPSDFRDRTKRVDVVWDGCGVGPDGRLIQAPKGRRMPFVDDNDTDTDTDDG